jgi:hypothetical protein
VRPEVPWTAPLAHPCRERGLIGARTEARFSDAQRFRRQIVRQFRPHLLD